MERVDPSAAKGRTPARRRRLLAEILPVALILATLGGTLALVVSVQRRAIPPKKDVAPTVVAVVEPPASAPAPSPPPAAPPEPEPGPPPEDPTPAELARLAAIRDEEMGEAGRAAREAESLERAKGRTLAEASRMARRENSLRNRAKELDANLTRLESELQTLAHHRDMLGRERDEAKLALGKEKARAESGYSVQPYKGPNGTWRRPIAIECTNGTVKIQPDGPAFGLLDLSPLRGMRSNPFLGAVARETVRLQGGSTPDGAPSVPYILFVIRPDGIRPYYEALMRLEPLGLAFGYELVDQDWEIDYPNPDDFSGGDPATPAPDRWPADRPLAGGRGGQGQGQDSPLVGLGGSGLGASDAGGKPLLFSGESGGGGAGFEPTPTSSLMSGTRAGGGTGLGSRETSGSLAGLDPIGDLPRPGGGSGASGLGERNGLPGGVLGASAQPRGSDLALMPFAPAREAAQRRGNTNPGGNRSAPLGGSFPSGADTESLVGSSLMNSDGGNASTPGGNRPGALGRTTPTFGGPPSGRGRDTDGNGARGNAGPMAGSGSPSASAGGSNGSGGRSGQLRPGSLSGAPSGSGSSEMQNPSPRPPGPLVINAGRAGSSGPSGPKGAKPSDSGSGSGSPPKPEGSGVEPAGPFVGPRPERNLDLVVSCGPKGVVIHPGAYRLSTPTLKGKEANLVKALKTIVSARQLAEPETVWKPQVRFQVEPGGQKTYWTVRGQILMEGLDWPTTVRLADAMPRTFGQELR